MSPFKIDYTPESELPHANEIRYETDEELQPVSRRPKWQIPTTEFQINILAVVGRKYYLARSERSRIIAIERARISLEQGVASIYPTEWVENCIEWAKKVRANGRLVGLDGLLNFIENGDRREQFVSAYQLRTGRRIAKKE